MDRPLVTIGVISYNSASTIVETLESVKNQTYGNIELIISDDASKDNTVEICRDWLECNASYFSRVELITSSVNTGTCGNCDRVLKKSLGLWLRIIAADDILLPKAIELFMNFSFQTPEAKWIFSKAKHYSNTFDEINYEPQKDDRYKSTAFLDFINSPAKEQYFSSIKSNHLTPPADIVMTDVMRMVGGFEEKYGLNEDIVKDLKLTKAGIKCFFLDEFTMGYRVGASNVFSNTTRLFNIKSMESSLALRKGLCWNDMSPNQKAYFKFILYTDYVFDFFRMNKNNWICRNVYRCVVKLYKTILFID